MKTRRKKRWIDFKLFLLPLFLLVTGLSVMLYPFVSESWNKWHQSRAIAGYTDAVSQGKREDLENMWKQARIYNMELRQKKNRYYLSEEEKLRYHQLLNLTGNGIMGYIEIPSIRCSLPVYHGTEESVLQVAAGHIEGSSLPVGGPGTHCVISGHRGLPSARLFTGLDQLKIGDFFNLKVLNRTLQYQIDEINVVLPDEIEKLEIDPEKDFCTLVTCTPYGVNSHRLLVRGSRVEQMSEANQRNRIRSK